MSDIPIIDIARLRGADRQAEAAKLGKACREVGFFYVVNHGIPEALSAEVFAASRGFFALPMAAKEDVTIKKSQQNRGYVGFGTEKLDGTDAVDQKEAFNIGLELAPDHPEIVGKAPWRGPNLWPELPGFKETTLKYYDACVALQTDIHQGFAIDLGMDEHYFDDKLDRSMSVLRLLYYPPAAEAKDGEMGAGEHTDYGNLTILATGGVAGLQVRRRDGVWLDAPHVEGGFVCNIADCLMRWTNDVYVSTPHRVLRPKQERYSIAFFGDANPDAMVEVLKTCVKPGEVAKYPPITSGDYIGMRLAATYDYLQEDAAA